MPHQAPLPFPPRRRRPLPFIEGSANLEAIGRLKAWRSGLQAHGGRPLSVVAAVTGAPGAGKTMLLEREAEAFGVPVRGPGADFEAVIGDGAVVLDDVQELSPLDLFALIEAAAGRRVPLLIAGRGRLTSWAGQGEDRLPDLENRLKSIAHAELGIPDEAMLAQALGADLASRGLKMPFGTVVEAASSLRREFAAVAGFAALVERVAARGYRRPGPLLRDALAEADGFTL
ncbi:hypothetical protein [Parvularcula dongshanensis]|nr:hypothetical protein [Parvularcula dongshanensis]